MDPNSLFSLAFASVLCLGTIGAVVVLTQYNSRQGRKLIQPLTDAHELRLITLPSGEFLAEGRTRGQQLRLHITSGVSGEFPRLESEVIFAPPLPFAARIMSRAQLKGADPPPFPEHPTGDSDFDRRFVLFAEDTAQLDALDSATRLAMIELLDHCQEVNLGPRRLTWISVRFDGDIALKALDCGLRAATALKNTLAGATSGAG